MDERNGGGNGEIRLVQQALDAIGIEIDDAEREAARLGPTTRAAVGRLQTLLGLPSTGELDPSTVELARATLTRLDGPAAPDPGGNENRIEGVVYAADGSPLAGVDVVANRRGLRESVQLGRATTGAGGRYAIGYPPPTDPVGRDSGLDVQFDVLSPAGVLLYRSPVEHRVGARAEVVLAIGGAERTQPPEFTRLRSAVDARLGGLRLDDLAENDEHRDLTFLADATGHPRAGVALYAIANRLAGTTGLPAELLYALFRQDVPAQAGVLALADTAAGVDLERNAARLLKGVYGASAEIRTQAVRASVAEGIVAPDLPQRAGADLQRMVTLAARAALQAPAGTYKTPIGAVLDAAAVPAAKQEQFIALHRDPAAVGPDFWTGLTGKGFSAADVATLRYATEVGQAARGHLPLVTRLLQGRAAGEFRDTRDLARLGAAQWKAMLTASTGGKPPIGAPANITMATVEDALENYAQRLERAFERMHPTAAFTARLAEDPADALPAKAAVVRFLDGQPAFDLRLTDVDRYLRDNPAAVPAADRAAVRESLLIGQRVIKLAGRYAVARPLLADGVHSAQQVYAMGRSAFTGAYGAHPDLGPVRAARVFARAEQSYGMALALAMELNAQLTGVNPAALAPAASASLVGADFPNLQSLFGSLDTCACEHCRSVLSPAAYLVDLLHFLAQRKAGGQSLKQRLLTRRPDLAQIELSCANTNTTLPHIDLVNELLEDAVAPPANPAAAARARQTTLSSEELGANPQYVNNAAYTALANAVFPWRLPFDLPLAEARGYLSMLDTGRVALMRTFQPPAAPGSAQATTLAVEGLGMSAVEADIITAGPLVAARKPWDYWGLAENGNTVRDPVDPGIVVTGSWLQVLAKVRILLDRAGLKHPDLARLLNTTFVNPAGTVRLENTPPDSCDLATMRVAGLTTDVLDRLHRFERLRRRLGWDVYGTDAAIAALQAGSPAGASRLNTTLLRQLFAVRGAMARFGLDAPAGVALLGGLDTRRVPRLPGEETDRPSQYATLFANPAVLNPVDPIFTLNAAGTEIAAIGSAPTLAAHRPALVAAFELTDDELVVAIEVFTNGALTLANLSTLYRVALLARGLRLTMREFVSLRALVERPLSVAPFVERVDPFDRDRPELLALFCEEVDRIRASRFGIADLDHLLRHATPGSPLVPAPDPVAVGTLLRSVRDKLGALVAEFTAGADPTGGQVRRRLAATVREADVTPLMAILAGTSPLPEPAQRTLIASALDASPDVAAAQAALVGSAALAPGAARHEYLLAVLQAQTRRVNGASLVIQELADALGLPTALVAGILTDWFRGFEGKNEPLLAEFLTLPGLPRDPRLADQPIDAAEPGFAPYFTAYARLVKAAAIVTGSGLTVEDAGWLHDFGVAAGWLDVTTLPVTPTADAQGRYLRWRRLVDFADARAALGAGATALLDLARTGPGTGTGKQAYLQLLVAETGWSAATLRALIGDPASTADRGLLALSYPEDYRNEVALARLRPAVAELARLGVSAEASAGVGGWLGAAVTAAQAQTIRQSVKSRYTARQWPAAARPPRDRLREQQRDALVGYLLAHSPAGVGRWHDADDVYARYLIDVQMSAAQDTSRIVQATAAVQLFVQRCLLNLEPGITVDATTDTDWLQWQWMNRYRIWEANRQVFLYPENWIQPALRRDKSPFFAGLEDALLQGEATGDSTEDAFRGYLEKLREVARLEVMGTYVEPNRMHVVARKAGSPPAYYHRMWLDSSRWTAWTRIDLDITGNHVLPVVWRNRLYLFWVVIAVKANAVQPQAPMQLSSSPPPQTVRHLDIRLAWSEFKDGRWLPAETSNEAMLLGLTTDPTIVNLRVTEYLDELHIDLFDKGNHFGEFVWTGSGNPVETFRHYNGPFSDFEVANPDGAGIGPLPPARLLNPIPKPASTLLRNMEIRPAPSSLTLLTTQRPRVAPLNVRTFSYRNYYGDFGHLQDFRLLDAADRYRLVVAHQNRILTPDLPFFHADKNRQYFVRSIPHAGLNAQTWFTYRFHPFYHRYAQLFLRELNRGGVDALLSRRLQLDPNAVENATAFNFDAYYQPTQHVDFPYPVEGVDFQPDAGYAIYNWELFFHAPLQIADALSRNQRFAEAKRWYEYIFNPTNTTGGPAPQRYWVTKPFFQMQAADYAAQSILKLIELIHAGNPQAESQVAVWRANPFDPHVIAGLRPVAYQRATVMRYIDNLIAWGDQLFAQDTRESVNEATQLYVLAADLLGPRPETVARDEGPAKTYGEIEAGLDDFSNAVTAAENLLAPSPSAAAAAAAPTGAPQLPVLRGYFAVPANGQLLRYWDTVEDRLFKVRHSLSLQGVQRQLALFAPQIDPALLVQAAAAGLDLGSVAGDTAAALPPYRFRVILRQAVELAQHTRALGADLLNCLEKRDADGLERLRATNERTLQVQLRVALDKAIEEADRQLDALASSRDAITVREQFYAGRRDELMNGWETAAMLMTGGSLIAQAAAGVLDAAGGVAHVLPKMQFGVSGVGGSPHATVIFGGDNAGHAASSWAAAARIAAAALQTGAQMSATTAQYQRRRDDWRLQHDIATKELAQLDAQTAVAQVRHDIAERQLADHDVAIDHAAAVEEYLQSRYTNAELYEWMVAQTSSSYFQAYQLAYTVAKRAERCLRHELGVQDTAFIQFGYWDSLKKGLLAADRLLHDLHRMEAAYHTDNARDLELTRHVSLRELDPYALAQLRSGGECTVRLPELLFDLDNPGHYQRRLVNVGVSVPCVVGPYGGVSLTLTLLASETRVQPGVSPQYARQPGNDPRFVDEVGGGAAIVTSSGRNDTGLFETRLEDDRYLPFEGSGAISTWRLRLNAVYPQFDPRSITDVVLHVQYTARDAGAVLAAAAENTVRAQLNSVALAESREGLHRMIEVRQEYAAEWSRFLHPGPGQDQVLTLDTPPDHFAFFTRGMVIRATGVDVLAKFAGSGSSGGSSGGSGYELRLTPPGAAEQALTLRADPVLGGLHHVSTALTPPANLGRAPAAQPYPQWTLKIRKEGAADFRSLTEQELADLTLILRYEVTP